MIILVSGVEVLVPSLPPPPLPRGLAPPTRLTSNRFSKTATKPSAIYFAKNLPGQSVGPPPKGRKARLCCKPGFLRKRSASNSSGRSPKSAALKWSWRAEIRILCDLSRSLLPIVVLAVTLRTAVEFADRRSVSSQSALRRGQLVEV